MNPQNMSLSHHTWLSSLTGSGRPIVVWLSSVLQASPKTLKRTPSTPHRKVGLDIEEIRTLGEWGKLEPVWNNLLDQHDNPSIFLSYEWLTTWWKCIGNKRKELLILVVKDGAEIIGIAPLMEVRERFLGLPITKIEFISMMQYPDSPANCSAALDMLIGRRRGEVVSAVIEHIARHHARWHFIRLSPVCEYSSTLSLVEYEAERYGKRIYKQAVEANAYIDVTSDWNEYRMCIPARVRKTLAAQDRKLREIGNVSYEEFTSAADIKIRFDDLLSIEQRSWKWDVGVSINSVAFGEFYRSFAEVAARKHWIRLWMLKLDDKYIAYDLNAVYNGNLVSLKTSYDDTYRKYSPGNLLTWHEFERFFTDGVKRINLMWGDFIAKQRWSTQLEPYCELFVFNTSFYATSLRMLFFSLSLYHVRKTCTDYLNRIARKMRIRRMGSELTRSDQVGQSGVTKSSIH